MITLKDLDKELNYSVDATENILIYKDRLRQEAIKEIKALENIESSGLSDGEKSFLISIFNPKVINYIKWKNNITEDDIK